MAFHAESHPAILIEYICQCFVSNFVSMLCSVCLWMFLSASRRFGFFESRRNWYQSHLSVAEHKLAIAGLVGAVNVDSTASCHHQLEAKTIPTDSVRRNKRHPPFRSGQAILTRRDMASVQFQAGLSLMQALCKSGWPVLISMPNYGVTAGIVDPE